MKMFAVIYKHIMMTENHEEDCEFKKEFIFDDDLNEFVESLNNNGCVKEIEVFECVSINKYKF